MVFMFMLYQDSQQPSGAAEVGRSYLLEAKAMLFRESNDLQVTIPSTGVVLDRC